MPHTHWVKKRISMLQPVIALLFGASSLVLLHCVRLESLHHMFPWPVFAVLDCILYFQKRYSILLVNSHGLLFVHEVCCTSKRCCNINTVERWTDYYDDIENILAAETMVLNLSSYWCAGLARLLVSNILIFYFSNTGYNDTWCTKLEEACQPLFHFID